jgi:hypothetical protein
VGNDNFLLEKTATHISTCSFHDVTSTFMNGTSVASGSGRGLTSLANTFPPWLRTLRRVARPMPEDAPAVVSKVQLLHSANHSPVIMTTWSLMPSRALSANSKLVMSGDTKLDQAHKS